mmetsp:Transcript_18875/g.40856  ORF Transcript_18875/g.40856 Transcript_18875/m.40856 type:complete len:82 (+) Transcript_18875:2175-2420(+)
MFCMAQVFAGIASRGSIDVHHTGREKARVWQMVLPLIHPLDNLDWDLLIFYGWLDRNPGKYHGRPLSGDGIHSARGRDIGS